MIYIGTEIIKDLPDYLPKRFQNFWQTQCMRYGRENVEGWLEDYTVLNAEKSFKDHEHLRASFAYYVRESHLKTANFTDKQPRTTKQENPYDQYLTEEAYFKKYGRHKSKQPH